MEQITEFMSKATAMDFILITIVCAVIVRVIKNIYTIVTIKRKFKKKIRDKLKKLNENKCKGPHSWVNVPVSGEETHVCKDCYYTPKYDSFVDEQLFKAELDRRQFDKDLEEYKKERFRDVAEKFGLELIVIEGIYDEIIEIKKDFSIQYMDNFIKDLLKKDD